MFERRIPYVKWGHLLRFDVARGGWRIYEVGISYAGRTYDEGKKIGWRDGVRALVCIIKYSPVGERMRGRR